MLDMNHEGAHHGRGTHLERKSWVVCVRPGPHNVQAGGLSLLHHFLHHLVPRQATRRVKVGACQHSVLYQVMCVEACHKERAAVQFKLTISHTHKVTQLVLWFLVEKVTAEE